MSDKHGQTGMRKLRCSKAFPWPTGSTTYLLCPSSPSLTLCPEQNGEWGGGRHTCRVCDPILAPNPVPLNLGLLKHIQPVQLPTIHQPCLERPDTSISVVHVHALHPDRRRRWCRRPKTSPRRRSTSRGRGRPRRRSRRTQQRPCPTRVGAVSSTPLFDLDRRRPIHT